MALPARRRALLNAAAPLRPVGSRHAALVLALLLGLQPLTTDVYLPALPALARDLEAPMHRVQLTMSALMLAFGFAQMAWGPVADRVGRRPVMLAGLSLHLVASAGCLLATSIEILIAWRVLQGVAMAAAVVCARAIVRDLYVPAEGARVMSLALSGLGVIAMSGPALGGVAALVLGWRGPLALVTLVCAAMLAVVGWGWPETLARKNPRATAPRPLVAGWVAITRDPVFRAWALLVACSYGGVFTMLAASSFVFVNLLGLSAAAYGGVLALASLCYVGGTFVCRHWLLRHGMAGAVARGGGFTLAGGACAVAAALWAPGAAWPLVLAWCLFNLGHGSHQPCGQAGMVAPFPQAAGTAAAVGGLALALVAFGIGRWLGGALGASAWPMAGGLAFWAALTCALAWTLVQRHAR